MWLPRDLFGSFAMFIEKMKNVVIHLILFWFELQMKTQGKHHLLFLPAPQSSVRCCKIFVIEGFSKFMSFLQKNKTIDWKMLLPRSDVSHFSKASFNFSYVPVFTLCCFSDEFWKASKTFSLFFFHVARVLPGILNWFAISLLGFKVFIILRTLFSNSKSLHDASFLWPFFIATATNSRMETNLKISKHSNVMAFKLKHLNLLQ